MVKRASQSRGTGSFRPGFRKPVTEHTIRATRPNPVLVGSRGIGAAIAKRLGDDGATVSFSFNQSVESAEGLAVRTGAIAVQADSADRQALTKAIADRGALDIAVINAGIGVASHALEMDPDVVDRMIDVKIWGAYHSAVETARQMHDGGCIIFIGSINGDRVPWPRAAAYAMTKSALQDMVRSLSRNFGERGITVNGVQPGPVDTDMNPANGPKASDMHAALAIKRHTQPEEVAGLVAYLVGPEDAFVTGALHTIDGGFGT